MRCRHYRWKFLCTVILELVELRNETQISLEDFMSFIVKKVKVGNENFNCEFVAFFCEIMDNQDGGDGDRGIYRDVVVAQDVEEDLGNNIKHKHSTNFKTMLSISQLIFNFFAVILPTTTRDCISMDCIIC